MTKEIFDIFDIFERSDAIMCLFFILEFSPAIPPSYKICKNIILLEQKLDRGWNYPGLRSPQKAE